MRNLFICHNFYVPHTKFTLWFFGDVHYGINACDVERFKWFLKRASESENPYFIGMGDYNDFAAFGDDRKIHAAGLHEPTEEWIESKIQPQVEEFAELIKPVMKDRLIGLIGGNHQYTLSNGRTTDMYLAELMNTKYLGWLSVINIPFMAASQKNGQTVKVFACHGQQGGKLLGTSLNKVCDMSNIIADADVYCQAHDHQRMAVPRSRLFIKRTPNENRFKLHQKRQYFVRSGSFMKSYMENQSGFAQGKLMMPADLGAVYLTISTHRNADKELILDIEGTA